MTVDLRTRIDCPHDLVGTEQFFVDELPGGIELHGDALVDGTTWLDPRPLTIEVDGDPWTLVATDGLVTIDRGPHPDAAHVRVTREQLDDLARDQQTFVGLWTSGRLDQPAGRLDDLLDWWLVLRAALDGEPIHTPGAITFESPDGSPLDLHRAFRVDDDRAEMRHFLEEAGYLHLTQVFTEEEMAEISAEMDAVAPSYSDGDQRSWWAGTSTGERRLVRMQAFDERSPATAALVADARFLELADIPHGGHTWGARADNRIEALFKPIGVVEGISDVPWHKDCSLGRHSYECCSLTVGVSVTGADATSGQLRVRAGSHRTLVWPSFEQPKCDLPAVDLPTRTGDVTMHLSCTLHMAQPPVERERRVMYSSFSLAAPDPDAAAAGRAKLREVREAAPVTVNQPPSEVT
jgi:ectoine hydroxylase-related dioxygenase (phytanoyl-CoA dioxygenase family)